jgi:hypothetical protein
MPKFHRVVLAGQVWELGWEWFAQKDIMRVYAYVDYGCVCVNDYVVWKAMRMMSEPNLQGVLRVPSLPNKISKARCVFLYNWTKDFGK